METPVYVFKHVKHGTQNILNYFQQWLSGSFIVDQIRFWPGLRPGPRWGSFTAHPDLLAGLRGVHLTARGKGEEGRRRDRPPYTNS